MALKPTDMLEIQSAIDEYERKFPSRVPPSAEMALAWRLGKREARSIFRMVQQESSRLAWAWEQLRRQWQNWILPADDASLRDLGELPWVRGALLVGGWSVFALLVATVFFFGALVGGFK